MIGWLCGLSYLSAWGISSGYILYVANRGLSLDDLYTEDFLCAFFVGSVWPITLPMYIFYNLFKDDAEKEDRK